MAASNEEIRRLLLIAEAQKRKAEAEAAQKRPLEELFQLPSRVDPAAVQQIIQGATNAGAGLLGLGMDATGQTMSGQFQQAGGGPTFSVPMSGSQMQRAVQTEGVQAETDIDKARQFVGEMAPLAGAAGLRAATTAGRLAAGAVSGATQGAAQSPGERVRGAATGAAVGGAVEGGAAGSNAAVRWLTAKVDPVLAASRAIRDEALSLVAQYMPKGTKGFASDLYEAVGRRTQALRQRRDHIWDTGLRVARQAAGGNVIIGARHTGGPLTVPGTKLEEAVLEARGMDSIPAGLGNEILRRLDDGMTIDGVNEVMVRINKLDKHFNPVTRAAAADLRKAVLADLKSYTGPGAPELLAMRDAYGKVAREIEEVNERVLKRLFGTTIGRKAQRVPEEIIVSKFSSLLPSEQRAMMDLLRNEAPAIAAQARGVFLANALRESEGDLVKFAHAVAGEKRSVKLSNLMTREERAGLMNYIDRWRVELAQASGASKMKVKAEDLAPLGIGQALKELSKVGGRFLVKMRTWRSVEELAFTEEGQRLLKQIGSPGILADTASVNLALKLLDDEGQLKDE